MFQFRYGGKNGKLRSLIESPQHLVVRTESRVALSADGVFEQASLSPEAAELVRAFEPVAEFTEAGVEVLRARTPRAAKALRDRTRSVLKKEPAVEFAGRVLVDRVSNEPVIYTENYFVKFGGDVAASACVKLLKKYRLSVKRELAYARNSYFAASPEGTGLDIFAIAEKLLREPDVELCHPELIRRMRPRQAFAQQWHLKRTTIGSRVVDAHASVEAAWTLSDGRGATIAVIDDGVDLEHEEFRTAGKIIAPRDVSQRSDDPRPHAGNNHGTACAGVACANGTVGASGVAPRARLLPIRLASALGSQAEADGFAWAADNGADVISCSWGPVDGDFRDPSDPSHEQIAALPDSTRAAIDYAIRTGRGGKGCVICFAAGNGNESVDNDGYASYERVLAIAACDDQNKKAPYSDFGRAVWCAFPSNHFFASLTPGIWTTDRSGGSGYNSGKVTQGDGAGNYTNSFGGTSSACPGAAGVAALVIARNPALRWDEVRDILRRSCDRIDIPGGQYDSAGRSPFYGFGRLNARTAVELALPSQLVAVVVRTVQQNVTIADLRTAKLTLAIADAEQLTSLKVTVNLEHTFIGDLVITVRPPSAMNVPTITLHNREGDSTDNLNRTYDPISTPALAACLGKPPAGTWELSVADRERQDTGTIRSFTLEFTF